MANQYVMKPAHDDADEVIVERRHLRLLVSAVGHLSSALQLVKPPSKDEDADEFHDHLKYAAEASDELDDIVT